ncbi:MAG: TonB-dependent receptor [Gemmatimonadota bacterium]
MRRPRATILALCGLLSATAPLAGQRPVELDTLRIHVGARAPGSFPALTRATQVLDRATLSAAPVRTVAEALAWVTGADLHQRSPAQGDLALRGSTFEQVLVLVDGVRVSDAQTGHFDLDLSVPLAEVERIEVLRGAATSAYGSDAMGGVVNVVTRRATGARATIEGGSFGAAAASLSGGWERAGSAGRAGLEFRRADGHRPGTDYDIVQGRASASLSLGERRLDAALGAAHRDFGARAFYTPATAPFDEHETTRTLTASAALLAPEGAARALEPRLSVRRHDDDFLLRRDDPAFYRNEHTGWQLGAELAGRWRPAGGVSLAAGGEAWLDLLDSSALGEREERRGALYAEAAAGRPGGATGTAGLRLDAHETFGAFVAPSLSGAVWLHPALRLRAAAGRAFRAPSWTDRYYADPASVGNPDLDPERSWEVEGGAVWSAGRLALEAGVFFRRTDEAIDWARPVGAPEDEPWRTRNVERTDVLGVELEAGAELAGARWRLAVSALDQDSRDAAGFVSRYALRPLTRSALVTMDRPLGEHLNLNLRVAHARRAGQEGPDVEAGACVPGRESAGTRADARLSGVWGRWRLFTDALNLADAATCEPGAVFAPGRSFRAGLEVGR